jgi:hypothetical protein
MLILSMHLLFSVRFSVSSDSSLLDIFRALQAGQSCPATPLASILPQKEINVRGYESGFFGFIEESGERVTSSITPEET